MKAQQARVYSTYKKYFEEIKMTAISGKHEITIYDKIDSKLFEDLGYKVQEWSTQKDGYIYKISW